MSDEASYSLPPTSPDQPVHDGILRTQKEFAGALTLELGEDEIKAAMAVVIAVQQEYATKPNNHKVLEQLRDEAVTRMAEIGVLATLDPTPCFYGEPPILEILGKVAGDPIHTDGYDHERKAHEVKQANARGEDYLGQKGRSR